MRNKLTALNISVQSPTATIVRRTDFGRIKILSSRFGERSSKTHTFNEHCDSTARRTEEHTLREQTQASTYRETNTQQQQHGRIITYSVSNHRSEPIARFPLCMQIQTQSHHYSVQTTGMCKVFSNNHMLQCALSLSLSGWC